MKKRTGCFGILILFLMLAVVFLFWPSSSKDDGVVLSDTFDKNDNNWELGNYGVIQDGELLIKQGEGEIVFTDLNLKNGSISAQLIYKSGDTANRYGIIFRDAGDNKYDYFMIDSTGKFFTHFNGRKDIIGYKDSFINPKGSNDLKIELFNRLIRIYVNGTLIVEAYEEHPAAGGFAFYSGGSGVCAFDNLKVVDFSKSEKNLTGTVYFDGTSLEDAVVTAYQVTDPESLGVIKIAETRTDSTGKYGFYLPSDSGYFVKTELPGEKSSGDRYADLSIPDSGKNLDIHLKGGQN